MRLGSICMPVPVPMLVCAFWCVECVVSGRNFSFDLNDAAMIALSLDTKYVIYEPENEFRIEDDQKNGIVLFSVDSWNNNDNHDRKSNNNNNIIVRILFRALLFFFRHGRAIYIYHIYSAYNNNNNGKMCVYTQFHLLLLLFVYICVSSLFQCTLSCSSLLSLALSDFIAISMFCLYKLMFQPGYTMILYYIYDYICHYYYYYTTTICLVIANNVFIKLTISGILFSTYTLMHT